MSAGHTCKRYVSYIYICILNCCWYHPLGAAGWHELVWQWQNRCCPTRRIYSLFTVCSFHELNFTPLVFVRFTCLPACLHAIGFTSLAHTHSYLCGPCTNLVWRIQSVVNAECEGGARWRSYNQKCHDYWSVVPPTTSGRPGRLGWLQIAGWINTLNIRTTLNRALTTLGCVTVRPRLCVKWYGSCGIWKVGPIESWLLRFVVFKNSA